MVMMKLMLNGCHEMKCWIIKSNILWHVTSILGCCIFGNRVNIYLGRYWNNYGQIPTLLLWSARWNKNILHVFGIWWTIWYNFESLFFLDARIRAGEIVKGSRSDSGSPERALLSNEATPMHRVRTPSNPNNDNSSIFTENIDLSSPGFTTANRNIMIEPPRNIFDDV